MSNGGQSRSFLAWLALGSALFTVVGSLVPFEFRARHPGEAYDSFMWAMRHRLVIESRSDGIANVMLGIPLGFALLGWLCANRVLAPSRVTIRALAVLMACVVFAALVEFAQIFAPARTCSGSDVLAQGFGAVLGMLAWLAFGQRLANQVSLATADGGTAGRFAIAYLVLLAFTQALPLDLNLSPYRAYHKLRSGRVETIPFGEFRVPSSEQRWQRAASLVKLAALYLPFGLLVARSPARFWTRDHLGRVAVTGIALATAIELGQVVVETRSVSVTDIIVGSGAFFVGWAVGRVRVGRERSFGPVLGLGVGWLVAVGVVSWQPFTFAIPAQPFNWVPGSPLEGGNPLVVLEELLTKLVLFGLGGALLIPVNGDRPVLKSLITAAVLGLAVSAIFEIGQRWLPHHTPGISDVLLGGFGAVIGAWVAGRTHWVSTESGGWGSR